MAFSPPLSSLWPHAASLAVDGAPNAVALMQRMRQWAQGMTRLARPVAGGRIGPIGLDIGHDSLNLVQLRRAADGRIGLKASACLRHTDGRDSLLASPLAFKARLAEAQHRQAFSGRKVVTALPSQQVRILPVHYDSSSGRSDASAISQVLRERLGKDLSTYVVDFMPVRGDTNASERLALVAVAQRDDVIAYLELLRKAGLEVLALEIRPAAIRRLITAQAQPDNRDNEMVITFGASASYLTVVSGRRLLQDMEVAFGEQEMLQQITTALQSSPDEARALVLRYGLDAGRGQTDAEDVAGTLAQIIKPRLLRLVDEINRVLIYTASETRGASVGRIYLSGSLARWPGIEGLLQAMLEIPVQVLNDPLDLFPRNDSSQALTIAAGLALRGMNPDA